MTSSARRREPNNHTANTNGASLPSAGRPRAGTPQVYQRVEASANSELRNIVPDAWHSQRSTLCCANMLRFAWFAVLCLSGCTRNGGDEASGLSSVPGTSVTTHGMSTDNMSTGTTGVSDSSTGAMEDSTAAVANSTGTTASTTGIPDAGPMPDGGPPPPPGCKGKIDILFSISSGPNMKVGQDQLKASFPGFAATIEEELAEFDYHIMVAGTRGYIPACVGCKDTCADGPPDYPCGVPLGTCDVEEGAGVTLPRGWNASNERCELYAGRRYIVKDEPNLPNAFTCIATVGTSGEYSVADDAVLALSPKNLAPDGCNWQFLRDDALLVVVVIAESDDDVSDGQPPEWTQALLDAKGGNADAIVLLVVSADNDSPQGLCKPWFAYEPRLRQWVDLMPHALHRSICAPDFAPYFAEAVTLIKQQCEVFIPG
jgi:hypothetical protein